MTLTDTQLILLSAAAQQNDHFLTPPASQKARAAQNAVTALLRRGLVEELPISAQQPHWRTDDAGQSVGFRITSAGFAALGIELAEETGREAAPDPQPAIPAQREAAPRAGTKQDLLLQLLRSDTGATVPEMRAATGWLAHTTRAALTGLRKKGYAIERISGEAGSTYRIHAAEEVR